MVGKEGRRMVNIRQAEKITGWMAPSELRWLARRALGRQRILELGTFRGRSARALLDNSEAHLWCVDTWDSRITRSSRSSDIEYHAFLKNVADVRKRVTVLRMDTHKALAHMPSEPFDMIFIDADHTYEWVKHDILNYAPLLKLGGLLCGHDYFHKAPGLMKAVDELIGECPKVKTIWWIEVGEKWLRTLPQTN